MSEQLRPAEALVAQMRAEGVDPTDKEALARWMEDFNSRSFEERDRVIGSALGGQREALDDETLLPGIGGALAPASEGEPVAFAMGWFPPGEYEQARELWDELGELWMDIPHDEYCRRLEATLRGWSERGVRPKLVPLRLTDYLSWCQERGEDSAEARARYAAEMLRLGRASSWPPGRNDLCWCSSGRKYKKCCGAVTASTLHPLDVAL